MKLIIAGGRDYTLTEAGIAALDEIDDECSIVFEVVSGDARGIDLAGQKWARRRNIPIKHFPADWKKHGKAAGPLRNGQMARYADALAIFAGGNGSRNMRKQAISAGLILFDYMDRLDYAKPDPPQGSRG